MVRHRGEIRSEDDAESRQVAFGLDLYIAGQQQAVPPRGHAQYAGRVVARRTPLTAWMQELETDRA